MVPTGRCFNLRISLLCAGVFFLSSTFALADVIINVLAINSLDKPIDKEIEFSLPAEVKPVDITDAAGLQVDYNVNDAGYYLHGKIQLQPKETKTLKVKVKDIWQVSQEQVNEIKSEIEQGFKELGAERNKENGVILRDRLLAKLDYILAEQSQASGGIDNRIDTYRNHVQTIQDIRNKTKLIDFWRTDASEPETSKTIAFKVEVENKQEKTKKVKEQHFLPKEVRPEYIVDRKGYEVRYDDKKGTAFLFKEEDLAAKEKKTVSFSIKDVWQVSLKELEYLQDRSKYIDDALQSSKFSKTARLLFNNITNNVDLIKALQDEQQPDIQQHIGAFRLNKQRLERAKEDMDSLEKLLSRHRADLEKSKVKNVMQKIQSLKSLARVSQAIFDKKPTVNAAWKLIGSVMIFLGIFTIIHFVTWFARSAREKKQEEMKIKETKTDEEHQA